MSRQGLLALVLVAACGGGGDDTVTLGPDAAGPDAAPAGDLIDRLRALPTVTSVTELPTQNAGYRRFSLEFTQQVDWNDASAGTFSQQVTLEARDESAPMVMVSTGYWNYYGDALSEPTQLLGANQIVVEYRYFGSSIPAAADWTKLTIENAAHDQHAIRSALGTIYGAAWLATGASKGGMTSVYYDRFWPDDLAGTLPYVAPISFAAPDYRYDAYYQALGTPACRQALQDLEVEMLQHRRAMLEQRTQDEATANNYQYTRVAIGPAVEGAVTSLYWGFWQYYGIDYCANIPPVTATDDDVWTFLDTFSPPSESSDDYVAAFQAYYYQSYWQLGYPGTNDTWLTGNTMYQASDYDGMLPPGVAAPSYDGASAMNDIDQWVQGSGAHLIFTYGQWDPWSGGAFTLGNATDAQLAYVPMGTHGSDLSQLPQVDRDAAYAKLAAWTGVTPHPVHALNLRAPRIPGAILEAWRLRAASR